MDISGRRFGRLTALSLTDERNAGGSVIWLCQCDCGNEVRISYNELLYTGVQSCGCKKKEYSRMLDTLQTYIDGTSLEIIRSQKIPKDNTTGAKGVYLVRGKYIAKISFQKKVYYLGTFSSLGEAQTARQKAESELFGATLDYYRRYQELAQADPQWAIENPIQITVQRENEQFRTFFTPVL